MTDGLQLGPEDPDDGPGFHFWADFKASITSLTEVIQKQNRSLQAELAKQPRHVPLASSTVLNGSGSGIIDFGTPMDGRAWTVRQLTTTVMGGEFAAGAVGAIANWYIGMFTPVNTQSSQWRWKQALTPQIDNFSADFLTVRAREHLFVVIASGTAAATMVCGAVIHDRPMYDRLPTVTE